MDKVDILAMAYKNLMRRKARTFLTVLGVLIGTTSIIVMISLGLGLSESNTKMMEQWGSLNEVMVYASSYGGGGMAMASTGKSDSGDGKVDEEKAQLALNQDTVDNFKGMPGVIAVSPAIEISGQATWGKKQGYLQIRGIEAENMPLFRYQVGAGRLLDTTDKNSIVVGATVSDNFLEPGDPGPWADPNYVYDENKIYQNTRQMLDQKLTLTVNNPDGTKEKKVSLTVVGVMEASGSERYTVYAPIETMRKIEKFTMPPATGKNKNKNEFSQITLLTDGVESTKQLSKDLKEQGYNANAMADSLAGIESQSKMIQAVLGGIGSITLLVAAIGIVNTMIMSIYERTREIGIMKVMGASFSDIRLLFLTEAGLIGFFGGIVGLALSYGLSHAINVLSHEYMNQGMMAGAGMETQLSVIPPWLAFFALIFSIMIGVTAGLYPANKAVKLSPIEAIRNNG